MAIEKNQNPWGRFGATYQLNSTANLAIRTGLVKYGNRPGCQIFILCEIHYYLSPHFWDVII